MEGTIQQIPVWELVAGLFHRQATGIVTCEQGRQRRVLYVQNGRIVFARSNALDDRLGELLFRQGRLRYRDLVEAAREIRPGRRLGMVLVERRLLTPEELVQAVLQQVRSIVFHTFTWVEGQWVFEPTASIPQEVITLNIPMHRLLYTAILQIPHWSLIRRGILGLETTFQRAPESADLVQDLAIPPDWQDFLRGMEIPQTVESLCACSPGTDFETCRFLVAWMAVGIVRRVAPPWTPELVPSVSVPEEVWGLVDVPSLDLSFADLADLADQGDLQVETLRYLPQVQPPHRVVLSVRCRHRYIWHLLTRVLSPERACQEVQAIIETLQATHPWLWMDVTCNLDGELPWDRLTQNLLLYGARQYHEGLEPLVDREIELLRHCYPTERVEGIQRALHRIAEAVLQETPAATA
ncbi:MAG: DUF4388 domain-containing protein [Acidobacteria bacterium]|nr:DUF4388 domain-containing protein [Acidobacteriota bacterium]MDW7983420.1 DUF4388 domain-containing protein [Acidobacteriota bacterium]